jgi:hypothetical protein
VPIIDLTLLLTRVILSAIETQRAKRHSEFVCIKLQFPSHSTILQNINPIKLECSESEKMIGINFVDQIVNIE